MKKKGYRFYSDEVPVKKIESPVIYLEGDGVWIKVSGREKEQQNKELSHFVHPYRNGGVWKEENFKK